MASLACASYNSAYSSNCNFLTVIIGIVFQICELAGFADRVQWAIHWQKGDFGFIDFQKSFPFLNGLGLLFLTGTGISMWWKMQKISGASKEK